MHCTILLVHRTELDHSREVRTIVVCIQFSIPKLLAFYFCFHWLASDSLSPAAGASVDTVADASGTILAGSAGASSVTT